VPLLMEGAAADLLEPPVNVLRLSLHPAGMAPRIVNLAEWRAHLLDRLSDEIESTADAALIALRDELMTYPGSSPASRPDSRTILIPLQLRVRDTVLSLFSTTTVFGTPRDVTLSELAIESFYPGDAQTSAFFEGVQRPGGTGLAADHPDNKDDDHDKNDGSETDIHEVFLSSGVACLCKRVASDYPGGSGLTRSQQRTAKGQVNRGGGRNSKPRPSGFAMRYRPFYGTRRAADAAWLAFLPLAPPGGRLRLAPRASGQAAVSSAVRGRSAELSAAGQLK